MRARSKRAGSMQVAACVLLGVAVACAGPMDAGGIAGAEGGTGGKAGAAGSAASGGSGAIAPGGKGGAAGAGTACELDHDCDVGYVCEPESGTCAPGGACGQQEFALEATISDLFITLDRSCSMQHGTPTKWSEAVIAVEKLVSAYSGKIRIGLALFPDLDEDSCGQGNTQTLVPVGDNTSSAISNVLHLPLAQPGVYGKCDTNIDAAIDQLSKQSALLSSASGFGLLITDGKQNDCADAGGVAGTIQILTALRDKNVRTFIVGFKGGVDPAAMNAFAEAGGVPKSGAEKYYHADNGTELEAALGSIGSTITDCSFKLDSQPDNPDLLYAFLNDLPVPRDPNHQQGWDYDPSTNTVEFYGGSCEMLKNGQVTDVDVVFGCNQPSPR